MIVIAGLLSGGAAGMLGIGPLIAKRRAAAPKPEPAAEVSTAAPILHAMENLVLNPAGTAGTRFLMVTATFECRDAAAEQALRDREAEVRDRILALLGKKTVDQLTEIEGRERIKREILDTIAPLFPKGAIRKLFFPQFVIQ